MSEELRTQAASIEVDLAGIKSSLPKHVKLLDSDLKMVHNQWVIKNSCTFQNIIVGHYIIRVSLTTGQDISAVVNVTGDDMHVMMHDDSTLDQQSPTDKNTKRSEFRIRKDKEFIKPIKGVAYQTLLAKILHGSVYPLSSDKNSRKMYIKELKVKKSFLHKRQGQSCILKVFGNESGEFKVTSRRKVFVQQLDDSTSAIKVDTPSGKCLLTLEFADSESRTIICPPNTRLKVTVKKGFDDAAGVSQIDASISSDNIAAEGLLELLNRGSMLEAKSYVNAEIAQQLLRGKLMDPVGATVGGYYLLKIKDFNYMHDWFHNLAVWFPWIPDGGIIQAWKLMSEPDVFNKRETVKKLVLESCASGIPLFTEGVRLQFEALIQLGAISRGKDHEVNAALESLQTWIGSVDWTKKNTTIVNMNFDRNGFPVSSSKYISNLSKSTT